MRRNNTKKRLDPIVVVALIGLIGTIITVLFTSPLIETWFAQRSSTETPVPAQTTAMTGTKSSGKRIGLNQTVTGKLYFDEPGIWIFSEGPAAVTVVLDVGPYGDALIILRDPSGVVRAYVEQQSPGIARLVNFNIATSGDYTILVRNAKNEEVNYTLTVQDALTPPPP
ncbi:MAG: hypothetical protein EHM40_08585 [Chloroflexi bacterium]|nr:MAG: hypothetical protein EHM40_08585 [Chloroflexota bacterium]